MTTTKTHKSDAEKHNLNTGVTPQPVGRSAEVLSPDFVAPVTPNPIEGVSNYYIKGLLHSLHKEYPASADVIADHIKALEAQPKAPASAVECAQGIYEVLKTGKVYRLPDGEPHTGTYQEIVAEIITAHTASAVAEAREKALEEAAKWHDESEAYYTKHAGNYAVNDEHHKRHLQMALHHRQSAAWIRALKGKEGVQ